MNSSLCSSSGAASGFCFYWTHEPISTCRGSITAGHFYSVRKKAATTGTAHVWPQDEACRHFESHPSSLLILDVFKITESDFALKPTRQCFSEKHQHRDGKRSEQVIKQPLSPLLWSIWAIKTAWITHHCWAAHYRLRYFSKHRARIQMCARTNKTHVCTCAQTQWHRQTGPNSQAIWKAVSFSHLPTYNTHPHLCVCFFESFMSVASSTVFHSVKIEAIILPNAYLPALYAPSCTRRLLHDEVADMFHTHHPLPYVCWMRLSLRNLY